VRAGDRRGGGRSVRSTLTAQARSLAGSDAGVTAAGLSQAVVSVIGTGLRLLGQLAAARILGAAAFGVFVVARSAGELLSKLPDRGLRLTVIQVLPGLRTRGDSSSVAGLSRFALWRTAWSSAVLVAVAALVMAAVGALTVELAIGLVFGAVLALVAMLLALLQAEHRLVLGMVVVDLVQPLVFLVSLGGVALLHATAASTLLALLASTLVTATLLLAFTARSTGLDWRPGRSGPRVPSETQDATRQTGRWNFWSQLALAATFNLDVLLVGALLGPLDAGVYAVAVRLSALTDFVHKGVENAAGPRIASAHARGDRDGLQRLVDSTIGVSVPVTVGLSVVVLVGAPWLLALFGDEFTDAYWLLPFLLGAIAYNALTGPSGFVMAMTGAARPYAVLMMGHAVAFAVGVAVLASMVGVVGAAAARLLLSVSLNSMVAWWSWRNLRVVCLPRLPARPSG
jgi:O-antigen/teichoic acid export membrane protein